MAKSTQTIAQIEEGSPRSDRPSQVVASGKFPTLPSPNLLIDDRYLLQERLGSGGMGVVFRATDVKLGKTVALKFVRTDCNQSDLSASRLRKEAKLGARIIHEHAAQVLDIGLSGARPYLVLEFARGRTLAAELAETGPLPVPQALSIIGQACSAIEEAHEHGVIHRDLKPQNIMLRAERDGSFVVKVLDFGIARLEKQIDESEETFTATEGTGGTPHYMAPEVARGESQGDERADVYALGAVLYEILSGEKPHDGESRNAVLYNVTKGNVIPLQERRPDLGRELLDLVDASLQNDPADRLPTVAALSEQLSDIAHSLSSKERSEPPARQGRLDTAKSPSPQRTAVVAAAALAIGGLVGFTARQNVALPRPAHAAPSQQIAVESRNAQTSPASDATSPSDPLLTQEALVVEPRPEVLTDSADAQQPSQKPKFQITKNERKAPAPRTEETQPKRPEEASTTSLPSLWNFETENPYR